MAVNVRLTYRRESIQNWGNAFKIGQMLIRIGWTRMSKACPSRCPRFQNLAVKGLGFVKLFFRVWSLKNRILVSGRSELVWDFQKLCCSWSDNVRTIIFQCFWKYWILFSVCPILNMFGYGPSFLKSRWSWSKTVHDFLNFPDPDPARSLIQSGLSGPDPILGSLDLNIDFEYDIAQVHALEDKCLKLYFELYFDLFDVFVSWPPTRSDRFQGLI